MSQMLMSIGRGRLHFQLINVLAQIGITYFLCYLIMQLRFRRQALIAALILVGHWVLFVSFPGTEGPFMSKTTNIGARVDIFLFGKINSGYWVRINFITSTVTTLFGGSCCAPAGPLARRCAFWAAGPCFACYWAGLSTPGMR